MKSRTLAVPGVLVAVICGIALAGLWRKAEELQPVRQAGTGIATMPDVGVPDVPGVPRSGHSLQDVRDAAADTTFPSAGAMGTERAGQDIDLGDAEKLALLRDPEWRKARLAELRTNQQQANPGLAEELKLTADESSRLFEVLAGTRLALEVEAALASLPSADPAEVAESTRHRREMQRQQGESLRAMLGEDRYGQWQEYLQTRPVRQLASDHAAALERAGAPMDAAQVRVLTKAMIAEQQSLKQDILVLGNAVDLANPQTQLQAQQALQRRQAEGRNNILAATAPYLSAMQAEVLRGQMEQREAVERSLAKP